MKGCDMNRLLLSCLALGAMTSAATAEPVQMTADQMDGVTAGSAFAAAFGNVLAFGDLTRSLTDTRTVAVQNGPVGVGVGVAFGNGLGLGEGAAAGAETDAVAGGDYVIGRTFNTGISLPGFGSAQSISIAVGVDLFD